MAATPAYTIPNPDQNKISKYSIVTSMYKQKNIVIIDQNNHHDILNQIFDGTHTIYSFAQNTTLSESFGIINNTILTDCDIDDLLFKFFDKIKLKKIFIYMSKINNVPKHLHLFKNLEVLELCGNNLVKMKSWPEHIIFDNLKVLNLSKNKLKKVPIVLTKNLEVLDLSNNNINTLKNIALYRKLKVLNLKHNLIKVISNYIKNLCNLKYLDLSHNKLSKIENIAKLKKLTHLLLASNYIPTYPTILCTSLNLQYLNLSFNNLTKVDFLANNFNQLKWLDIMNNNINILPNNMFYNMHNLNHLNISYNNITGLPNAYLQSTKLKHLLVFGNSITQLPDELINLTTLIHIGISNNIIIPKKLILKPINAIVEVIIWSNRYQNKITLLNNRHQKIVYVNHYFEKIRQYVDIHTKAAILDLRSTRNDDFIKKRKMENGVKVLLLDYHKCDNILRFTNTNKNIYLNKENKIETFYDPLHELVQSRLKSFVIVFGLFDKGSYLYKYFYNKFTLFDINLLKVICTYLYQ